MGLLRVKQSRTLPKKQSRTLPKKTLNENHNCKRLAMTITSLQEQPEHKVSISST